ncbi:MAG: SLC13 family permease [Bacteroidales bacterium]
MKGLKFYIGLIGGIFIFLFVAIFLNLDPGHPEVTYTLAIAILMAIWWITEVVPLAITSLIPIVLFPAFGIMNGQDVSATYFNHVIFLFIGGFIIALAMQKWNLHKRIALKILMVTGISPGRILLGFMLATAFLSMWISNTATTMMMVPILISIIGKLEDIIGKAEIKRYSIGLLLGVAYSASIGGIATLVGTPPNLSFARIFQIMFPDAPEISFASWFIFAFPVTLIFFMIIWIYLYLLFKPKKSGWAIIDINDFKHQYKNLGPVSFEEKSVFIIFTGLAIMWLTRSDIQIGRYQFTGWSSLFPYSSYINDGTVAILASVILFLIPARTLKDKFLMDWETAQGIPWNIVLLFGGGFALASGFKESNLTVWFGSQLSFVADYHPFLVIIVICTMMTFLTELTSNTATTEMLLPILAGLSVSVEINPLLFMLPVTLSGSMAFMLPVATPPNAIVFGTGRLQVMDMARNGLALNFIGVIIISLVTWFIGTRLFDIAIETFPAWAGGNP